MFVHVHTQLIGLQEHACPTLMYGPNLFLLVFQKKEMFKDCVYYVCFLGLHCMENKLPPIVTHVHY